MGVENLWLLLEASGTKITIDSLATRKLAVDASLWLVQFIKAMRTPNGEMIENCHLLGLFRRICKLLFYNIKPVFVFDGPPPKLKRKTLKQRRIRREKNENDIKKQAERLFLNRCQMAAISISKKQLKKLQKEKKDANDADVDNDKKKKKEQEDNNHNHNDESARIQHHADTDSICDKIGINDMEQGFVFVANDDVSAHHMAANHNDDDINHTEDDLAGGFFKENDDEAIEPQDKRKNNDKEEMSDDDDDIAPRELTHNTNHNEVDNCSDDMGPEAIEFHQFPEDVSKLSAKDIAELPASMQFEIMSKRRELLRHKTRPEFVKAAGNPSQYAQVQLKAFLKTSSLNQKIESLRKQTADQFNQQLLGEQGQNNNHNNNQQRVGRIASEGNKMFVIKETENNPQDSHNMYRFQWVDNQTKTKRRQYRQKQRYSRYKKKRHKSDYVARTLNIEMEDVYTRNSTQSEIVFEHWSCPICKYLNLKQRHKCDVCGIVRDEALKQWTCAQCTHCNNGCDIRCVLCDTVNPQKLHQDAKPLQLEPRSLVIDDSHAADDDDAHASDEYENDDLWICAICHWKNSLLVRCCAGCNKMKTDKNAHGVKQKEAVRSLEVLMDDDSDDDDDESDLCLDINKKKKMEMNEADMDTMEGNDDLILSAPNLTLHLEDESEQNDVQQPPAGEGQISPTKLTSQISEMASSNVTSLLNIRDSLQNFYNIAKLTQQSTVLEEIQHDLDTEVVEADNDDDDPCDPGVEIVDEEEVEVVMNHVDDIETMEYSEHESDDDVIKEMDVAPGNIDIETPKGPEVEMESVEITEETQHFAPIMEQKPNNIDSPKEDMEQVPASFLFEIPTFDEIEEAESLDTQQRNDKIHSMPHYVSDRDEDEEKQIILALNEDNNEHKPLQRRRKKRKRTEDDLSTPSPKKRKISHEHEASANVERNIGLNEGQIQNSLQKLYRMEDNIMEENILLNENQATAIRDSEHITGRMVDECRHLLDMFGIPYITSPSEAEAQCAKLNELGLVDGIITDDSDVFLFGGKTIYKNLFHMNKYVEKYSASLLQSKLGLGRNKLISIALLLGSDYTDGIKGIGPVNGMEIVQTFCGTNSGDFEGLSEFKKWIYSTEGDKKPTKKPDLNIQDYDEYIVLKNVWFKYKHRNIKKHWFVSHDFPSRNVIDTYLKPDVDESDAKFEWGKPNINELKNLCQEKFDWDQQTINATLDPIEQIVKYGRGAVQSSILSFADWIQPNKKPKSLRIQKAVGALLEEMEKKKQIDAQRKQS